MSEMCVCCGSYVKEGSMVCNACIENPLEIVDRLQQPVSDEHAIPVKDKKTKNCYFKEIVRRSGRILFGDKH